MGGELEICGSWEDRQVMEMEVGCFNGKLVVSIFKKKKKKRLCPRSEKTEAHHTPSMTDPQM